MNEGDVDRTLSRCEGELDAGHTPDLRAEGFWRAVAAVKRDPRLVDRHGERIAAIDLATFRRRVVLKLPAVGGIALLVMGTLFGLVVLWLAAAFQHRTRELLVLVGMAALLVSTHDLAHFVVGTASGIRFTDWYVDLSRGPQPGLKIDYGSYLRARAGARALMHASGAVVSKIVPFAVIPYAVSINCDPLVIVVLFGVGVGTIVTDIAFSAKRSDWKRFLREMRLARR